MKIGIIGCGHMGSAIAKAILKQKIGTIVVSNPTKPSFQGTWTKSNVDVVKQADIIFIAVKPFVVSQILSEIRPFLKKHQLLISIAAGIPLKKILQWSGKHQKIVRVMTNLPAQVLEGMSVWKASKSLTKKEKLEVSKILISAGKAIEVQDEKLIDWATSLSGSAPAYTAAFLESFSKIAEKNGFLKKASITLALQAVLGSIVYIQKTGISFSELKKAVQTKGGTTEAAFKILNQKKWQQIFEKAIFAAYKRAQIISQNS